VFDEGAQVAANIQADRRVLAADDHSFNMPGWVLITSISPLAHAWCSGVMPSALHSASQSRVAHRSQLAAAAAAEVLAMTQSAECECQALFCISPLSAYALVT
jgi:LAS superfamily LD-carboxypeptidase LdcB